MEYILSYEQFNVNEEANLSKHYTYRKSERLYSYINTTPIFNYHLYEETIRLIENINYPINQKFTIQIKLDKYYISTYSGGNHIDDSSDKSGGSRGRYLYMLISNNEIDTIYFGDDKSGNDIIPIASILKLYNIYKLNMTAIKFNKKSINGIIEININKNKISSTVVSLNNDKYYFHDKYDNEEYVMFNTKTYDKLNFIDLVSKDFHNIHLQLVKQGVRI